VFKIGVDERQPFRRSKTVGAHVGLTPRRIRSGDSIDFKGHISGIDDAEVRATLYEAAHVPLTKGKTHSGLKVRHLRVAKRRGHKHAAVGVDLRLAMIMHRMWRDGSEFRLGKATASEVTSSTLAAARPRPNEPVSCDRTTTESAAAE